VTEPKRSKARIVILTAAATIAVVLIAVLRLAIYVPPEAPGPVSNEDALRARVAVESMAAQIEAIEEAAAEGRRQPFEVSLYDDDLTNFLLSDPDAARGLASKRVERPRVEFRDRKVVSSACLTVRGRRLHVTVSGRLTQTSNGTPVFDTDSVKIGKLTAPGPIRRRVDRIINDFVSEGASSLPAEITEITTDNGALTFSGVTNPDAVRR